MPEIKAIKVALVGNPNTGKTSLFNTLTGLNQKVGNYPGITVDKKVGKAQLSEHINASIVDLPGTYSINPTSIDENIVLQTLLNNRHQDFLMLLSLWPMLKISRGICCCILRSKI